MSVVIRELQEEDLDAVMTIWNSIVEAGDAFPQTEPLTKQTAPAFFDLQTRVGVAELAGEIVGLYILHPNNVGHCAHIANASYAVSKDARGNNIGMKLVEDSLLQAKRLGFEIMQFNAVVATNAAAICLYTKLGFTKLGTIPHGFKHTDGTYADIISFYKPL